MARANSIRPDARSRSATPRIAFLVNSLDDPYTLSGVQGALAAARVAKATLLCIEGGVLESAGSRNYVYELIGPDNADAVLFESATLGNHIGADAFARWTQRYAGMPVCSAGARMPGMASLVVDNASGMREAIAHLIDVHGLRRIAFIRGPRSSVEAEARWKAYKDVLAEHGIELDPRLELDGDFQYVRGIETISELFDNRKLLPGSVQAIVAANDSMALGALTGLKERGIAVPDQIAVVGFDDVEAARLAEPALTTVAQPVADVARLGFTILLGMLRGEPPPDKTQVLPTRLMIRRSCGCATAKRTFDALAGRSLPKGMARSNLLARRPVILAELSRCARGQLGHAGAGWEAKLFDGFMASVLTGDSKPFVSATETILSRQLAAGSDIAICHDVFSELRVRALPELAGEVAAVFLAEDLLHEARLLSAAAVVRGEAERAAKALQRLRGLTYHVTRLATFSDDAEQRHQAAEYLPMVGIELCALAECATPTALGAVAQPRIVFDASGVTHGASAFAPRQLVPPELDLSKSPVVVVQPVTLGKQILGLSVCAPSALDGLLLGQLRDLFGLFLMGRFAAAAENR